MNKKISGLFAVALIYLLVLTSSVSAHHQVWMVNDVNKQLPTLFVGDETWTNWWLINGTVSTYQSTSSTITSSVNTAVSNWNSAVPEVRISGSGSDLTFNYSNALCPSDAGCYSITSVYNDTTRNANFVTQGTIYITI
ncbi:hypothetical protein [Paenibacillus koleovorans]|uniref:hypothetical protein n=1 Tax=Paenibacillus koleovorans TaxID=121608 RepID=UPI000FD85C2F|nr:hypothetical protein [Paenibacillus koleovorans]